MAKQSQEMGKNLEDTMDRAGTMPGGEYGEICAWQAGDWIPAFTGMSAMFTGMPRDAIDLFREWHRMREKRRSYTFSR